MTEDPNTPLTTGHFDEVMRSLGKTLNTHGEELSKITTSLEKIETRLGNIETLLWQGQAIEELQQRIIGLARAIGNDKLAEPFIPSPGMAQPVQ